MAEDRKIFPVEQVLELVTGKKGADVTAITSFITGKANLCDVCAKAAGPFAAAWLARWYPRLMDVEWQEGENWEVFVRQAKSAIGDHVSLTPMTGRLKDMAQNTLDLIAETQESLTRQTEASVKLEKELKTLEPLKTLVDAAQKKNEELEARIKGMKTEITALNRKALEFEGKLAVDQNELTRNIREAIKEGLKGVSIAGATAAAADAVQEDVNSAPPAVDEDEFGFGANKVDDDGFGF